MTDTLKSWFSVVHVLWLLVFAFVSAIAYIVNWKSDMESRVNTLEIRGSPHLEEINRRLTVTEKETETNVDTIKQIKDVLLRDLHIQLKDSK